MQFWYLVEGLSRNHLPVRALSCSSSVIVKKAKKAQKLQLPVKTFRNPSWQRNSISCSSDQNRQSCSSGYSQGILWRKIKIKEPPKIWKGIWKNKKNLMWWQMNPGAVSKDEKLLQKALNTLLIHQGLSSARQAEVLSWTASGCCSGFPVVSLFFTLGKIIKNSSPDLLFAYQTSCTKTLNPGFLGGKQENGKAD